jgi:translation elongation factor EF-1alpha
VLVRAELLESMCVEAEHDFPALARICLRQGSAIVAVGAVTNVEPCLAHVEEPMDQAPSNI